MENGENDSPKWSSILHTCHSLLLSPKKPRENHPTANRNPEPWTGHHVGDFDQGSAGKLKDSGGGQEDRCGEVAKKAAREVTCIVSRAHQAFALALQY